MTIIKSFSVGNGDMYYIKHNSSNFTIIDCNLVDENINKKIINELKTESKEKDITRFISTHPDDDHIHGLEYLNTEMPISNFYCVKNNATKNDEKTDFKQYKELRDSDKLFYLYKGCSRKWLNKDDDEKKYGSSGLNILWPIIDNSDFKEALKNAEDGNSPNNISPIIKYSLNNGVTVLWFGDLETDFMEKIKDEISLPNADIIFAPHHGRSSGKLPSKWLDEISPKVIVIGEAPSDQIDYLSGYNTITQNTAGDIIFNCKKNIVDVYVSNNNYTVKYLDNNSLNDAFGGYYIGSLDV